MNIFFRENTESSVLTSISVIGNNTKLGSICYEIQQQGWLFFPEDEGGDNSAAFISVEKLMEYLIHRYC